MVGGVLAQKGFGHLAAGRVVHAYLISHDIKDIILEEEQETSGGRKYDLDIRVGDRVIDAKCSTMGLLTVPVDQQQLRCDIYAYVDITRRGACYEFIGWMLKEASRKNLKEVFDYVMANKKTMPRTALRYAIEKMPAELKKEAMAK